MNRTEVLEAMSEKISFVNKISLILKATSDDDSPVPGYMYQQISDISHESAGYCESLLEFLVERLDKNSYHVKLKVLKLMKYVIENGHVNFQTGLRKMSHGIRAATKYGGPPDPLHGNVPYAMVRKEAKDICEKLFNVEGVSGEEVVEDMDTANKTYSIVGMGPTSVNSSGGRIEGFGNYSSTQEKSLTNTIMDGISKIAEKLNESPADKQKVLLDSVERSSSTYRPPVVWPADPLTTTEPTDTAVPVVAKTVSRRHVPGRPGGGWDDLDPVESSSSLSQDLPQSSSDCSSDLSERLESTNIHSMDWSAEVELVNSTVEDESTSLLTRQDIATFQNKCASLNTDRIVEVLFEKLASPLDYIVLKSLLLLENFLRCDLIGLEFLAATCKDSLVGVYVKWEGPCRAKARKIIRILEKLTSHRSILCVEENGAVSTTPGCAASSDSDINNIIMDSIQTSGPEIQHIESTQCKPLLSLES